ncbi:TetR/AcrR family transcriptional regulator [Bosea caraganae]|uniref:TetR/AcrR family transcriptional regulator n=1 Tax=Bosea caraganae TaxID=2763117 RepID=A0A370L641_9HYPH|nr:TetR/AcrR family transcriptional regulator [Bosea caraganae]RDJ23178.1 TetR/AcrR family transcriptional regulator [Bosea caraganae]RDJ24709.1 TetR/AcrR family transcriptional regulator [Bosea caraganae]
MARPREFEEVAVLDAAVQRFWSHGYEASSMRDLASAMGITGASLYNAFGDKRSLYRRALDRYVESTVAERVSRLEGLLPPRRAIEGFFDEVIERSLSDPQRKGCMLVNSALELAPHDPEFRDAVAEVTDRIEAFFRRCAVAGQRDGTITTAQTADDLARHLLAVLFGLRALSRVRPERALLEGLVRPAYALLDSRT